MGEQIWLHSVTHTIAITIDNFLSGLAHSTALHYNMLSNQIADLV